MPPASHSIEELLSPAERRAADELVRVVRSRVGAVAERVFLFGSKARGNARPDSDVDLLFIFRALPPDREPQATHTEDLAAEVEHRSGVPVAPWSVSLIDLELGQRTPMLVDALDDGVPLWPASAPPVRIAFTRWDALRCATALLERVEEGSREFAHLWRAGNRPAAARRVRDDLVRLCTAGVLLIGETRPRRAHAIRRCVELDARYGAELGPWMPELQWVESSFGHGGLDEEVPVPAPPRGWRAARAVTDHLRRRIEFGASRLAAELDSERNPPSAREYGKYL